MSFLYLRQVAKRKLMFFVLTSWVGGGRARWRANVMFIVGLTTLLPRHRMPALESRHRVPCRCTDEDSSPYTHTQDETHTRKPHTKAKLPPLGTLWGHFQINMSWHIQSGSAHGHISSTKRETQNSILIFRIWFR